jgi:o-succinylbenzoate synthase
MNNLQLTYSPYTLQLKKPFFTAKTEIKERSGFILRLVDPDGIEGIGDCCPFPEFGSETITDVEDALSKFSLKLIVNESDIENSVNECLRDYVKLPSLRHGLEQAILQLICNKNNTSIDVLLNLKLKNEFNVNAAIGFSNVEESVELAKAFLEDGFNTLKLKTGRDNFEEDFSVINLIRETLGNSINLRIDINGKWNLNEAIVNLKRLEQFDIEYAEQPVTELSDFVELKKETKIPLAADEAIRSIEDAKMFIESGSVSYLILKPMLLGGLLPTLEIIRQCENENIIPIISSSFESVVGKTPAVVAAACVNSNVAHGLGVTDYFVNDITNDPFPIKSGKIILS